MNKSIIRYVLGHILIIEGALMLLPCLVALFYQERNGIYFLIVAALCEVIGFLMSRKKPKSYLIYTKEGCVTTALSWILLSIFGAIPFVLTGEIPSFTDALFETISGFTTTGASILSDVESLSHCSIFWRSFTHWIGGMGVLVFLLAIVPLSGGSNINLMKAESPGPTVGKLVPKVRYTARILYIIYFSLTLIQIALLLFGGMNLFDSVTISFGTAGTGGFSIKNDGMASYSLYIKWVVTIFMTLFGVSFNAYYILLFSRDKKAFLIDEVKWYFIIILTATAIITIRIIGISGSFVTALTDSAFQVSSIITTTGYSTTDFDLWDETSKAILVLLMFIGACSGSTGGGIKVSRFVVAIKTIFKEITSFIHPRCVKKIKMDGKPVEHETIRSINVYFITFIMLFVISTLLVSLEGQGFITTFTSVTTCINNIGPGLDKVGPTCNFGFLSLLTKYVLMFDMLAGRLELFPLLLLFHPTLIKDFFTRSRR
ncbi:MAG: TrkH family potassium uptake protein [Lachnospiraceae bacterium]|nr:TrkH family potassium uptake protein [Lachnospiraceae bacterium]